MKPDYQSTVPHHLKKQKKPRQRYEKERGEKFRSVFSSFFPTMSKLFSVLRLHSPASTWWILYADKRKKRKGKRAQLMFCFCSSEKFICSFPRDSSHPFPHFHALVRRQSFGFIGPSFFPFPASSPSNSVIREDWRRKKEAKTPADDEDSTSVSTFQPYTWAKLSLTRERERPSDALYAL